MEPITIVSGVLAASGIGFGIGLGARLVPAMRHSYKDLARLKQNESDEHNVDLFNLEEEVRQLEKPIGKKRDSSIIGVANGAIRHKDGSYTCAWTMEPASTMLAHDLVIEKYYDDLARMIAVEKPAGTVVQFRFSSCQDSGQAIRTHLGVRGDRELIHPEASLLHDMNLSFYDYRCKAGIYRQNSITVWVRVPLKLNSDNKQSGLDAFIATTSDALKKGGGKNFSRIRKAWADTADDGVIRRLLADEREARDKAEKVFRQIERECPLKLRRLSTEELWEALYLGHMQDAETVPVLPQAGADVRQYICGESIIGGESHIMHGSHPVAIVSMFVPPQPYVTADSLRILTLNPSLNFRHTILVDFVCPDQRKATKRLDKRIKQVRRTMIKGDGRVKATPEARKSLADLEDVRDYITGSTEALVEVRFRAVIFSDPWTSFEERKQSLKSLDRYCEAMITAMQAINGVDAAREEPDSQRALYCKTLIGETDAKLTGREITETAGSLVTLIPTETPWGGSKRPSSLFSTPTGRLLGMGFFGVQEVTSPLGIIVSQPGGGKSVFMARVTNDVLASLPEARVRAVDFGESFGPHADVLQGRHLRFSINDPRTINTWDYDGLERAEMPDEIQIGNVVKELMLLARVKSDDNLAEDILTNTVKEVYRNEVPRNATGKERYEPTLSHLLALIDSYPFETQYIRDRASTLGLALEKYRDHPWLDSPTHDDFRADSPYDVYELDSLQNFPNDISEALAWRVAARVLRSIGQLKDDGTRTPTLLIFDEVWKIRDKYPRIVDVIKRSARQGRKENVVTLLATQAYEDFESLHDVTRTAGIKVIGKQIGDFLKLSKDAGLSDNAIAAITAIKNVPGEYAQYVLTLGSGTDQIVEMIQCDLSPAELWTFSTNPYERNARARVAAITGWPLVDVIAWLAKAYPRGLASQGLIEIDESLIYS